MKPNRGLNKRGERSVKKSTVWLIVGISSAILFMIVGCCAVSSVMNKDKDFNGKAVAKADVDLEKLTKEFETYITASSQDINGFEKVVNDKAKGIYKGKDHVSVTMQKSGEVIGYVNKDTEPTYESGKDEMVFSLQAEKDQQRVVARDRYSNYYGHRPSSSGFFTGMLVDNMLSRQHSYYGYYWSAPRTATWHKPGYYSRVGSSSYSSRGFRSGSTSGYRSGSSSSYRSGSYSSGSRSGSSSGGFSFGKN